MSEQTEHEHETPAALREAADKGRRLERENAFLKAGFNPETDPKVGYFIDGYKGDLTTEAIKAEAVRAGFITPAEPEAKVEEERTEEPGGRRAPTDEEQEFDRMAEIGAESAPAGTQQEEDLLAQGWEKFGDRRKSGDRLEDASAEVITRIVGGAVAGDKRFLV